MSIIKCFAPTHSTHTPMTAIRVIIIRAYHALVVFVSLYHPMGITLWVSPCGYHPVGITLWVFTCGFA